MALFYVIAFLVVGIIISNIIHEVLPKIPDAFILIVIGLLLSLIPVMANFELEPEYFMLFIIAPLMFNDGQKTSIRGIRKNFHAILLLSVVLALITVVIVGLLANRLEVRWTLPLAIALAAIVTPTDTIAVKSLTSASKLDSGVNTALEYESLFNDASGLVMLNLALSVMEKGTFSIYSGLFQFVFVAVGGIVVGVMAGGILVSIRTYFNKKVTSPELTIIPIALLTPFIVYLLAESLGTSGIIAVVTAGIVHNVESEHLKLTATRVQLVSSTIWETLTAMLNSIVFILLGISLPEIFRSLVKLGIRQSFELLGLGLLIYVVMVVIRYVWAQIENETYVVAFFGPFKSKKRRKNAFVFGLSGVHGTITLSMAFSLPMFINGHAFPYREEILIIATAVILLSMVTPAVVLPKILPIKNLSFSKDELNNSRIQMIDYASLHLTERIPSNEVRYAVIQQLQSQKGFNDIQGYDKHQELFKKINEIEDEFLNSNEIKEIYPARVLSTYRKILDTDYGRQRVSVYRIIRSIDHQVRHEAWHISHGQITHGQRSKARKKWAKQNAEKMQIHDDFRSLLWELEKQLHELLEQYLRDLTKERLATAHGQLDDIQNVERFIEDRQRHFRRDYEENGKISVDLFIQAFQLEYNYVQTQFIAGVINEQLANKLYDEINQAQTLQMQQLLVEH